MNVSGMLERVASMCPCRVHRLRGPTESTESVDSKEREAKKDGKEQKGPRKTGRWFTKEPGVATGCGAGETQGPGGPRGPRVRVVARRRGGSFLTAAATMLVM